MCLPAKSVEIRKAPFEWFLRAIDNGMVIGISLENSRSIFELVLVPSDRLTIAETNSHHCGIRPIAWKVQVLESLFLYMGEIRARYLFSHGDEKKTLKIKVK